MGNETSLKTYQGECLKGQRHGLGIEFYDDTLKQKKYEGFWNKDKFINGKMFVNDVILYDGEFLNFKFQGNGRLYYKTGEVAYEGSWDNGQKNGFGKYYLKSGKIKYNGNFKNNKKCGFGILYYNKENNKSNNSNVSTIEYEGEWKDDNFFGKGKYYSSNGELLYEGEYMDGKKHGRGKIFKNGKVFQEGVWSYDIPKYIKEFVYK
jgi:antitoxin component YwqK of YwqJK toxin-antitoxin module